MIDYNSLLNPNRRAPDTFNGRLEEWWPAAIKMYASLHNGKHADLDISAWFQPRLTVLINAEAAFEVCEFWDAHPTLAELFLGESC